MANIEELKIINGTFWLTRKILLQYISFIYVVAFLVALNQNESLIGLQGLLPANIYLNQIKSHFNGDIWLMLNHAPTLLWFTDYDRNLDTALNMIATAGLCLSTYVLLTGKANFFLMITLWILYHSIVNVGQRWYSFGWESQLLETGFLIAFLCPFLSLNIFSKESPPSFINIFLFRWLIFRIMLGAGLIKIRGDSCWRDLTCMNYHYETQPVPNPLSYYMHQEPLIIHQLETVGNHFVELFASFFLILPRRMCIFGGFIQIAFQVIIIISGNLSFLNWLTIAPSFACFDDAILVKFFPSKRKLINHLQYKTNESKNLGILIRKVFNIIFGLLIAYLSIPIVQNLLSQRQVMNTSFDPLRIVNTYGAFGSITKKRTEVIFEGTYARDPSSLDAKWFEYEFHCKPGDIERRPCLISPYHYRLDWLMWFAAFQSYEHNDWLVHLALKFLKNDNITKTLISKNPFENKSPPLWVRADHYSYKFSVIGKAGKAWWKRKKIGSYLPTVSLQNLMPYARQKQWIP